MNKLTKVFEGQEVIIKMDKGNKVINLVHTAKCCGLEKSETRVGRTTKSIRWSRVSEKLQLISGGQKLDPQTKTEIQYILQEIENTDDRNSIYMSSWLSKRLALECHSEKANRYKNFLVTMDEARENGQVAVNNVAEQQAILQLAQSMQGIGTVVQGMQTAMINIEVYVKDSIQSKDLQIDQAMKMIGLRAINTMMLSSRLKDVLSTKEGIHIYASNPKYLRAKKQIFKRFRVIKWEDIPVNQYNAVHAFIEEL
ncbi:hypothetical protein [Clostridium tagluense]|uniref:hypothetical protein n=1 Tax=Clostridium tagluense TaxID=360422 RepID=UPI001CF2EA9E|nr:hypothetical protein [Clostridium tagluense]MCB2297756.1 hypothetical protein [Clostridium tagluense]